MNLLADKLKNNLLTRVVLASSCFAIATFGSGESANAAVITLDFTVSVNFDSANSLTGQDFSGALSYDDSNLTPDLFGFADQVAPLESFSFSFLGQDYTLTDDPFAELRLFNGGGIAGADFSAAPVSLTSSFLLGFDPTFSYFDATSSRVIDGTVVYSQSSADQDQDLTPNPVQVPEPGFVSLYGALLLAGVSSTLKKQQA
jgi:hypothetical protein